MSRTIKGGKGPGYEYWSKRPGSGGATGKKAKKFIHHTERQRNKKLDKAEQP